MHTHLMDNDTFKCTFLNFYPKDNSEVEFGVNEGKSNQINFRGVKNNHSLSNQGPFF